MEHLEAILGLVQGFNGNHELIPNWCIKCDAERVHGDQACPCPCHEARQFLDAVKKELEMPRL
jgi:hypothetical protein